MSKPADLSQLDALTGGAFSAPTSGERAARLREWLASEPSIDAMSDVYRELSHRDKGAAKSLKEKLDEIRRAKAQDAMVEEWAAKARHLLEQSRLNLADAMAWQRDAAKAGAPLSREPLLGLKQALSERMKAIEDLQHRVQVEREAAVLLAQRIEVLSTKSWVEAQAAREALSSDVSAWQAQASAVSAEPVWGSLDPKYPAQLDNSRNQLQLVWEAFGAALDQAELAAKDEHAALPAVPVWADEIRSTRKTTSPGDGVDPEVKAARVAEAVKVVKSALDVLSKEIAEGHSKTAPKAANDLRNVMKEHGRYIPADLDAQVHAALAQVGEMEGWQRWRADQLREELLGKAVALTQSPEGQRLGGKKMQETLRQLREQWKATDQGGTPNVALWKKFDEACNQAHKVVEAWLGKLKEQNETSRAQRLALIDELQAWTQAHAQSDDWKAQLRDLHAFAERWRLSGHLSEKLFAELQPKWKAAIQAAHLRLDQAQSESQTRRQALIAEAQALGAAPVLHIDSVKALQQRWQQEAHTVPLERRLEQKLWEAFRKPIDAAFERKTAERQKVAAAVSAHDKAVIDAAKALETACASGDAGAIRAAMAALNAATKALPVETAAQPEKAPEAVEPAPATETLDSEASSDTASPAPAAQPKKLVAMRGDDRPGMQKTTPVAARPGGRETRGFDTRDGRQRPPRGEFEPRAPRLGDAAFRAQRQAMEHAELALKKMASQAHGEALTQLLAAWESRQAEAIPAAQALGGRQAAAGRPAWAAALANAATSSDKGAESLLRLEMAAEVPTPAEHLDARRALQLQMLTRRHDLPPSQTWVQDVAKVFEQGFDAVAARRVQAALKVLLKR